jgi:hypothetical protein
MVFTGVMSLVSFIAFIMTTVTVVQYAGLKKKKSYLVKDLIDKYSQEKKESEYLGITGKVSCDNPVKSILTETDLIRFDFTAIEMTCELNNDYDLEKIKNEMSKPEGEKNCSLSIKRLFKASFGCPFKFSDETEIIKAEADFNIPIESKNVDCNILVTPEFWMGDIKDWTSFIINLKDPNNAISKKILSYFSPDVIDMIKHWNLSEKIMLSLLYTEKKENKLSKTYVRLNNIVKNLNIVLQQEDFYDQDIFKNLELKSLTKDLLCKRIDNLSKEELKVFNRTLIETAFPNHIIQIPQFYIGDMQVENIRDKILMKPDVLLNKISDSSNTNSSEITEPDYSKKSIICYQESILAPGETLFILGYFKNENGVYKITSGSSDSIISAKTKEQVIKSKMADTSIALITITVIFAASTCFLYYSIFHQAVPLYNWIVIGFLVLSIIISVIGELYCGKESKTYGK